MVLDAAAEARLRGDDRIGTDHLLLGLLRPHGSLTSRILGIDMAFAQAAWEDLDRAALAAVGIDVGEMPARDVIVSRRRPPLTSGARAALKRSVDIAKAAGPLRRIEERHLLLAILGCRRPDPAAELLAALGVDPDAMRERLAADSG
jgi:hypothetical protein